MTRKVVSIEKSISLNKIVSFGNQKFLSLKFFMKALKKSLIKI